MYLLLVQSHNAARQRSPSFPEVLPGGSCFLLTSSYLAFTQIPVDSGHGSYRQCVAFWYPLYFRSHEGVEFEFPSFTLYFLAFDHSNGADTPEVKKAQRTAREGK